MPPTIADTPLLLPCGISIPNRIGKSALTEGLSDGLNRATERHCRLYKAWSEGGSGLLVTGNIQVDRRYLERPGNPAIDGPQSEDQMDRLRAYAEASMVAGNQCWVQLGHPGRQASALINTFPCGPSDIGLGGVAGAVHPLTDAEILDTISRFAFAAGVVKDAGFSGVQLHGAHGYLASSFLNPLVNTRTDRWGGSLENRARLLLDVVAAMREVVGPDYPVSVKVNSSDFQEGGFSLSDMNILAGWLDDAGLDLLEISGGNYEHAAILFGPDGQPTSESSRVREAYFMEFAADIRKQLKTTPLMVTGGIRSRATMEEALAKGDCEMIGIGRPVCGDPDCVRKLLVDGAPSLPDYENLLMLDLAEEDARRRARLRYSMQQSWYYCNEWALGDGEERDPESGCVLPPDTGPDGAFPLSEAAALHNKTDAAMAAALTGIDCVGTVYNAAAQPKL